MADLRHQPIEVSIIIPAYNCAGCLDQCLAPLQSLPSDVEIIVVDDGSTDDSATIARRFDVTLIVAESNIGPGPARNLGAKSARGNILLFLDSDVVANNGAVAAIRAELSANPGCTALFGSYDAAPAAPQWLSQYRNLLHHFVHQTAPREASHFWAGFGAVRSDPFHAIGGFKKGYYGRKCEDIDFGYRLRESGYRICMDKTIQVRHLKHWTLCSMLRTDFSLRGVAWTRLLLTRQSVPGDFSLGIKQKVSVLLAGSVLLSLFMALVYPPVWLIAGLTLAGFLLINGAFLHCLYAKNGLPFAFSAIFFHLLYNLNAGLAFACGVLMHFVAPINDD